MGERTAIDWCDATINPVIGCSRGCSYCYARRLNDRFKFIEDFSKPQWFPRALEKPYLWKRPKRIFICSMGELFDQQVPAAWVHRVFAMMGENPRHRFLLLTKGANEACVWFAFLPENAGIGISVTSNQQPDNNLFIYMNGRWQSEKRSFISFEPLLGSVDEIGLSEYSWVIIGAQTGPGGHQPKREWVEDILRRADAHSIPVFMKGNLKWDGERRQEWPKWLELGSESDSR